MSANPSAVGQPLRITFGGRVARAPIITIVKGLPGVELNVAPPDADISQYLEGAEVLVMSNPRGEAGASIAAYLRGRESRIRWVQIVSAGVDGLIRYSLPRDLILTNQGGAVASTVAEHVFSFLLMSVRAMRPILESMALGNWDASLSSKTRSLEGKALCVVGLGHIGQHVARLGAAFGMKVTGLVRSIPSKASDYQILEMATLRDAMSSSDVVVVCLALTEETRHLFDAELFEHIKKGAMLVNISRGEIVDSIALRAALESGQLGSAFIDVAEKEPLDKDDPLWRVPNLVISPHIAATGGTFTGDRIAGMVKDNVMRYQRGEALLHRQPIVEPASP